jgi:hypothetical protein
MLTGIAFSHNYTQHITFSYTLFKSTESVINRIIQGRVLNVLNTFTIIVKPHTALQNLSENRLTQPLKNQTT